ncbi:MAG: hypothetical protein JSU77_04165 [Fidelibacterota bacterium]|nr:MAG: hypothetical protein JSU77_04165 [Candidatus Neomarinimicrobiota bacterium]
MVASHRDDILEILEDQFADLPGVHRGMIFGHPGFKVGDRVFCFAWEDGLCLKLPKADYEAALELEEAEAFAPGGSKMGTWVVLSFPEAPQYLEQWHWVDKALAYIVTDEAAPPKKRSKRRSA